MAGRSATGTSLMNRLTLKRIAMGVLATTIVAVAALTTGVLRPAEDQRLLFERADKQARSCVRDAGHGYPETGVPLGELQSGSARRKAYEACWTRVASDSEYSSLNIPTPSELMSKARFDGFSHWRCVERAGFRRTTPIPLSAPDGYPLMPASRHFAVSRSQSKSSRSQLQLAVFYGAVARCGDLRPDEFKGPDGKFADVTADGASCKRVRHSGDSHSHGCFATNSYPEEF